MSETKPNSGSTTSSSTTSGSTSSSTTSSSRETKPSNAFISGDIIDKNFHMKQYLKFKKNVTFKRKNNHN